MAFIGNEGEKIYWEAKGSGPAVFLTHGYAVTGALWDGQLEAFQATHRMIAWDMRGHGRSDSPAARDFYTEDRSIEDMQAVLAAAGEDRIVLGGLSLGGYLSLAFYHRHPERVRALILCDTGPGFKAEASREAWNRRAEETAVGLEQRGPDALRDIMDNVPSKHQTTRGLILSARGLFRQKDSRIIESLPEIRVPTLVVVGENDEPLLAGCHYMAKKIPGAKLVVVPRSGHYPNVDEPRIFNDAVREFLAALPP